MKQSLSREMNFLDEFENKECVSDSWSWTLKDMDSKSTVKIAIYVYFTELTL